MNRKDELNIPGLTFRQDEKETKLDATSVEGKGGETRAEGAGRPVEAQKLAMDVDQVKGVARAEGLAVEPLVDGSQPEVHERVIPTTSKATKRKKSDNLFAFRWAGPVKFKAKQPAGERKSTTQKQKPKQKQRTRNKSYLERSGGNNWQMPFFVSLMGALVGCMLFVAIFGIGNSIFNPRGAIEQNTKQTHEYIPPRGNETETSAVVEAVSPGTVTVLTGDRRHYLSGNGSGIVYKEQDGKIYILTNAHVIENAAVIEVYRNDLGAGAVDRATVVAADEVNDIAVLVLEKPEQAYPVSISFEDSTKLKVGQKVLAIGSPYVATLGTSFSGSVTEGILSGLNREIESSRDVGMRRGRVVIQKYIQTDAAINGGNSGGALLDMSGNLIGMNSAKINSADNIGLAIATNDIIAAMQEMDVPLPTSVN